MDRRKNIIVGIDPGTTIGYSVIDIDGNILKLNSSRLLSFDQLILEVTKIGKPILVATDKKIVPSYVGNFARKTGAKIISPNHDLKVLDKKNLTIGRLFEDNHQMDALAAALFALKNISHLISKIEYNLDANKGLFKSCMIEDVIHNGLGIDLSISKMVNKEERVKIIEKKITVSNTPKNSNAEHYKINQLENENNLLRRTIGSLENDIKKLIQDKNSLISIKEKIEYGGKSKSILRFKEKREYNFHKQIQYAHEQIRNLQEEVLKLNCILSAVNGKVVVKKLKNLGSIEFEKSNQILNMGYGDILMVDDPGVISQKVLDFINKNNIFIITNKKIFFDRPFIILDKNKVKMIETKYFALAEKEDIHKQISAKNLLNKIIADYQETRT